MMIFQDNNNGSSASVRKSNPTGPIPSVNIQREILTMRQNLLLDLKRLRSALTDCTSADHFFLRTNYYILVLWKNPSLFFEDELLYFSFVEESY